MRRNNIKGIVQLAACVTIAAALGTGCETKSSKPTGGASKESADATKTTAGESSSKTEPSLNTEASPSIVASRRGDQEGNETSPDHDRNIATPPARIDSTPMVMGELADLSKIGIKRRPSGAKPENKRDATADLIYATVRVKMDILIAERKELLAAGLDTTDPEIRQRESSINRAIALLTENGETVDPIVPPLSINQPVNTFRDTGTYVP